MISYVCRLNIIFLESEDDQWPDHVASGSKGKEEGTEDDGIFKNPSDISMIKGLDPGLFAVESDVFRIWTQTVLSGDGETAKELEAIIDRSGKIHRWKER